MWAADSFLFSIVVAWNSSMLPSAAARTPAITMTETYRPTQFQFSDIGASGSQDAPILAAMRELGQLLAEGGNKRPRRSRWRSRRPSRCAFPRLPAEARSFLPILETSQGTRFEANFSSPRGGNYVSAHPDIHGRIRAFRSGPQRHRVRKRHQGQGHEFSCDAGRHGRASGSHRPAWCRSAAARPGPSRSGTAVETGTGDRAAEMTASTTGGSRATQLASPIEGKPVTTRSISSHRRAPSGHLIPMMKIPAPSRDTGVR